MPPGTKRTLEGRELHGGSQSFPCDPHLLGVTSGHFEAKETSLGNSRPNKNFFEVLPAYGMYSVLRDVTATACDQGYGLIFKKMVLLGLKIDYVCIDQLKK